MLCLLALHPEEQAKVFVEASELWPEAPSLDAPPVRVSLSRWVELLNHNFRSIKTHCPISCVLNTLLSWILGNSYDQEHTTAVFYESLRLLSPVIRLMRTVFSDTILSTRRFTTNADGSLDNVEVVNTPIKAGSVIVLDINGLHYNRECY